ncbi:hypothetical protein Bb109J_c1517 [Bdellovibrio bacteriovorus]|nr:hypothetical protein Bb109J_c1517 [Bdellovibrio bacteriovorus]
MSSFSSLFLVNKDGDRFHGAFEYVCSILIVLKLRVIIVNSLS